MGGTGQSALPSEGLSPCRQEEAVSSAPPRPALSQSISPWHCSWFWLETCWVFADHKASLSQKTFFFKRENTWMAVLSPFRSSILWRQNACSESSRRLHSLILETYLLLPNQQQPRVRAPSRQGDDPERSLLISTRNQVPGIWLCKDLFPPHLLHPTAPDAPQTPHHNPFCRSQTGQDWDGPARV